jgi:ABC-2 type transport system permease protein
MLWSHAEPFQSGLAVLYALVVLALWHAPIYGWLLLVSGWARRTAVLWAVLPFVAIAGVERILFGTARFAYFLQDRLLGWVSRAFAFGSDDAMGDMLGALTPVTFLSTPSVWIGLAFTAACLAVAIRLRHKREPA